ncbi:HupE/UreJ family protein [Massilia sp. R2A-15]|uniref:HupE/UreJ family protein n=1 Tax=Massilia sp. R2A-15 TaxID=3064278 RepID=UPI00273247CA|nr:HupE/UreJ family protein [Massilia sp. R2A-15]WLI91338.1 HupE/UreJ family protein [Massilia sp. R2A-15]
MIRRLMVALLALLLAAPALAHKPSDSYLTLKVEGRQVTGQWDIALRDLDMAIGLDADGNGELTWDEVRAKHAAIAAYALSRLSLAVPKAGACPLAVTGHLIDDHSDGAYAVLHLQAACPAEAATLDVEYKLLFDIDPQHKGLLRLEHGALTSTAIFTPDSAHQSLQVDGASRWRQFADYVKHGVWHIWIGYDHILFLLSLLLPAVLVRRDGKWDGGASFHASFIDVLKIVTAFTLAHSITLSLAALGVLSIASRVVESAIALSVALAALNNIWPLFHGRRALAAFCFGLIHGFGFASVLLDLGLPATSLLLSLVGFNAGVELGQLTIVAIFLPLAFAARRTAFYRNVVLVGGSALIFAIATVWLAERLLNLKIITA